MIARARTLRPALAALIIVILVAAPQARQAPQFAAAAAPVSGGAIRDTALLPDLAPTDIELLVGRSTIVNVGNPIARVSLTVPDIADAMVTAPSQVLIHGKQPGTISLFVWDRAGAIKTFEVRVRRDLTALVAHLTQLFPGEPIEVRGSGKDVVVSGTVSSKYVIEKAAEIAGGYVEKKENVVNLLKQQEGVASNQVMLRVRFAEVSRSAVTELGASLFTGPTGYKDWIARSTTQQFSSPNYSDMSRTSDLAGNLTGAEGKYSLSDFLNIFVFNNKYNVGTVVRALQEKGLFQSLAEPNLIATNGKEASFLAGGEYPYPVVQGSGNNASVTIMFKEYGVRLTFTPTVLGGDLINLKVKPEVSSLDFANAVTVSGFRVPSLSTRRTETEVELRDGQTFAIAGLLNNSVQDSMRKIPGIGDIPILGWLFKSRALQKAQTELVVMITPTIIRRGGTGVSEALPSLVEPYMAAPAKTHPNADPYIGSPRYPATMPPTPRPGGDAEPSAAMTTPSAPAANGSTRTATPASRPAASPAPAKPEAAAAPAVANAPAQTPPVVAASGWQTSPVAASQPSAASEPTKAELKAQEKQRQEEKKAAKQKATDEKRKALEEQIAQAKADKERRAAEKAAKTQAARDEAVAQERAARDGEVKRRSAEVARLEADEQQKRDRVLADAAGRLKEAQAAYQAEVDKAQRSTNGDKAKSSGTAPAPRR